MKIIARIETDFPSKFAIPRQSGILADLEGRIVFEKEFQNPDFIRGIEEFSHLWLIWCFSENEDKGYSPTVRPPRLGGNLRKGVFATRSPFRPNPIGLSCVRLIRVEKGEKGCVLVVAGADLVSGTPIYDIKPYLPFSDSYPDAAGGFASEHLEDGLEVSCAPHLLLDFPAEKKEALFEILRQDPRPSYHQDEDRIYGFPFAGFEIRFQVKKGVCTVLSVEKV